jgi:hypothetical protein
MRRTTTALTLLCAAAAVLHGCACDTVPNNAVTACSQQAVLPGAAKTDILFVIDDSGSMALAQANLRANFQAFVDRLVASPVKNDFQIGVTTTSVHTYDAGASPPNQYPNTFWSPVTGGSCPTPPYPQASGTTFPQGLLVSVTALGGNTGPTYRVQSTSAPPRILAASSNTLANDFVENAYVGICGSGKEQGLEASRLALEAARPGGGNEGFLRPGALLAVIIVSDDDDCSDPLHTGTSAEPTACTSYAVQNYVDYFKGPIAGEARSLVLGLIVAVDPADPTRAVVCREPSGNNTEHAALRYRSFADAFPANSVVDSVCKADFHDTLVQIAGLLDPGQVLPLEGTPSDWRLLTVQVHHADGTSQACPVSGPGTAGAEVEYLPPDATNPARLRFGGACLLRQGDTVDINLICAG